MLIDILIKPEMEQQIREYLRARRDLAERTNEYYNATNQYASGEAFNRYVRANDKCNRLFNNIRRKQERSYDWAMISLEEVMNEVGAETMMRHYR